MSSIFPQFNLWYFLLATLGVWQFAFLVPWYLKKVKLNKRNEGTGIIISSILGIVILLSNLDYIQNFKRIDLDKLTKTELLFDELPEQVQHKYNSFNFEEYRILTSTDPKIKGTTYSTTMDDGFITLLKEGFKHHFLIDGNHYILQANQGDPYVLHENKLYFCVDLNLNKDKVKDSKYIEIDISSKMKKRNYLE
jgi:hypothetical protein